jgi:hypothetical protein
MVKADRPTVISQDKATVYFVRPSGIGFLINFQVWDGDKFIGLSQAKSYFRYECEPGKHLFLAVSENKTFVPAELAVGKRYYIVASPQIGFIKARVGLTPVKKGSENAGEVKNWEADLNYVVRSDESLKSSDFSDSTDAREYIAYFNALSPEKKAEYGSLVPDDGM